METRLTQRRASESATSSLIMSSVFATVQQAVGCKGQSASFAAREDRFSFFCGKYITITVPKNKMKPTNPNADTYVD